MLPAIRLCFFMLEERSTGQRLGLSMLNNNLNRWKILSAPDTKVLTSLKNKSDGEAKPHVHDRFSIIQAQRTELRIHNEESKEENKTEFHLVS
ncbi:hypothetical protein V6N11_061306 [Hibiscus sabdariffa]|uniref:Uncharacterized protein n=1 Tax=Hibiscus sabdariffa TaxID=183260 RepID=A0ABR2NVB7_9ROSI